MIPFSTKPLLILLAIGIFGVTSAVAAPLTSDKDTKALADQFMTLIGKGSYTAAFDLLKPNWPLPAPEISNMAYQTETQLKQATERFGKVLGYEYILSSSIGKSYTQHVYLQKFSNHATRWMVIFYRPSNEWIVNAVNWDDKPYQLFGIKGEQDSPANPTK